LLTRVLDAPTPAPEDLHAARDRATVPEAGVARRPRRGADELAWRARLGALAGAIAGAATTGVVVGFGLREGSALRPFASLGRHVLAMEAAHTGARRALATGAGLLLHLLVMLAWGVLFGLAAARWRGWRRWAAAVVIGALAFAVDHLASPEVLRLSDAPGVSALQRATLYVVLALALVLGMRVALSSSRPE